MAAPTTDSDAKGQAPNESKPETEAAAATVAATGDAKPEAAAVTEASDAAAAASAAKDGGEIKKWPGWPGCNVFRMIVPVLKVGGIIGKKGELIKKLCEETKAKVRILDGPIGTPDRIVLISGKEEPEAQLSPAMDAVLRVFKRINAITETGADATACSVRLLVASSQAINLIGKQGSSIKAIQESSGAMIRVLTIDDSPHYSTGDERVVDIQGEAPKVIKGLEAVIGHLRKFLVDPSIVPLFEKIGVNAPAPAQAQDRPSDPWSDKTQSLIQSAQQPSLGNDYMSLKRERDSLFLERDSLLDSQRPAGLSSLYRQDPSLSGLHTSALGRGGGALVTQVTQTMQIPLSYAEDIIGVRGANIAYIRRASGAVLTVQESGGQRDEITVEIKGTSSEVKIAEQLIQDFIAGHKEPVAGAAPSSYGGGYDAGMRSSYLHLEGPGYGSSSLTSQPYGGYGSSGLGGYGSYRL